MARKLIYIIAGLIISCSRQQPARDRAIYSDQLITTSFAQLDSNNISALYAATHLLKNFGATLSTPIPDTIIDAFLHFSFRNKAGVESSIKTAGLPFLYETATPFQSTKERQQWMTKHASSLYINYFGQRMSRCSTWVLFIDYSQIEPQLSPFLSAAMRKYLHIIAAEEAQPLDPCEPNLASPHALVDRVVELENFIRDYPAFIHIAHCKELQIDYRSLLLYGNSSHYFVNASEHLSAYHREAYEYLECTYPNSAACAIVKPWHEQVLHFRRKVFSKLWLLYEARGWLLMPPVCCGMC